MLTKIEAGLSPILYHWTTMYRAVNILSTKEFFLSMAESNKEPEDFFLSTTRSKLGGYHINQPDGVIFVLDGVKLGQKYKGVSHDFYEHNPKERGEVKDRRELDEMEDRIYFNKKYIPMLPFTKEIHVYDAVNKTDIKSAHENVGAVVNYARRLDIPCYLYPDRNSWLTQNKRKAEMVEEKKVAAFVSRIKSKYSIKADFEPYKDKLWVHYSGHTEIKLKYSTFHQDPIGIYFFPEGFKPKGNWHTYFYVFTAKLKPQARVLDMAKIKTKEDAFELLEKLNAIPKETQDGKLDMGNWVDWKPFYENIKDGGTGSQSCRDLMWEWLQRHFIGKKAAFTKAFLNAGYDAIFDDTDSIFSGEDQLIVLNPKVLTEIKRHEQKGTGYPQIEEAAKVILEELKRYDGEVLENARPQKKRGMGRDPSFIDCKITFASEPREQGDEYKYTAYGRKVTFEIRTVNQTSRGGDKTRFATEMHIFASGRSDKYYAALKELSPNAWDSDLKLKESLDLRLEEFDPKVVKVFVNEKVMPRLWDDKEALKYKESIEERRRQWAKEDEERKKKEEESKKV